MAVNVCADSAGYVLPSSGSASTTQFILGTELSSGTGCGVSSLPDGKSTSGGQGGGPGYLYAAINQLAFGSNPSAGAGGPGGACGICYEITPVSSAGVALSSQALTFMIVDECPASIALSGGSHCNQCTTSEVNDMGQHWHFDIAVDAMSTAQYSTFFNGVTDGSNWLNTTFQKVSCIGSTNPTPNIDSWGCISGLCPNNDDATVCASTGFS
ncbi:glycoside hydrolase family 45 protein [Coleophoma cylindrospora]|uniref:Glycoside hydrolase family 45 protein n=1 Tax=Coleophoma cylindrospora TaxID=1849047 RepID=A0A3D8SD26_9HELO|nr:glycoside hydrolase family 45 protein [Coleophoma cylindrospora]